MVKKLPDLELNGDLFPTQKVPVPIQEQSKPFDPLTVVGRPVIFYAPIGFRVNRQDIGLVFPGVISSAQGTKETLTCSLTLFVPTETAVHYVQRATMKRVEGQNPPYFVPTGWEIPG